VNRPEQRRSRRTFRPANTRWITAHSDAALSPEPHGLLALHARFRHVRREAAVRSAQLAATQLTATIDPRSIETDYPDPKYDFNEELAGEHWLMRRQFPQITFRTTRVEDLGNQAMRVHGELTLHGVTKPIVLDATYNGGYLAIRWIRRPAWDSPRKAPCAAPTSASPAAFRVGSNMGVGDQVAIVIESEFKVRRRRRPPRHRRRIPSLNAN
jgi:polyisoprenoid-binding protein YceI